jgi:hypothetical protein
MLEVGRPADRDLHFGGMDFWRINNNGVGQLEGSPVHGECGDRVIQRIEIFILDSPAYRVEAGLGDTCGLAPIFLKIDLATASRVDLGESAKGNCQEKRGDHHFHQSNSMLIPAESLHFLQKSRHHFTSIP